MTRIEEEIGKLLRARRLTLAVAESCTGGLICHLLTNIPGSSDYLLCGFVTYGNRSKNSVLHVDQKLMEKHGAVSAPVVRAMARGAREAAGADYALAVSGIAGPGGGSPGKPVGLVYFALEGPGGTKVARKNFIGGRHSVKEQSALTALMMLRDDLLGRE